ncbi:murein biosynthesis integral membrane protein MurJ [Gracilibacillus caseinilyticus]|uniref:Lipid II flippase n=1 Tax=Gracilibacillus caseinilyticus TaxID=2932256 RepID=A0ABY4F168_9BACI|nr:murein biosynthesis integral membrane protein MurJ [Gracilibacillus caseinilyticus]UOQ50280.1 murein biosynthesis integral membrane protein MurJ [Gracilibacillus caseinilyticus]
MKSKLGLASLWFIVISLLLKVSGLIRDMVIAFYFGDSYVADAYLAAFIIPNMFILFMTTGMKNAFVPSYTDALQEGNASSHLKDIYRGNGWISLIVALLGAGLAPVYVPLLYPDFSPEALDIAVYSTMILFAAVFFTGMNAVLEALFDAKSKFSLSVFSQVIVILTSILSAFLFAEEIGAYSIAIGYVAGTVISLILKKIIIRKQHIVSLFGKLNKAELKSFYPVFIPVGLTVAVGQINLMIGTIYASKFSEGAITYINYAKNLVHMPQALFGVTIGTIIFPILSKAISTDNRALFKRGIEQGLTTMYFVLLPATIGMMLLMPNIIALLYQRGAFSESATMQTSYVAYYYFGSVLFFSLNQVINKGFYSLKKGHVILFISGSSILLTFALNAIFTHWLGYLGIPLAASVNGLLYALGTFLIFLKQVGGLSLRSMTVEFLKTTFAVAVMSAVVLLIKPILPFDQNLLIIVVIAIAGAAVYTLTAWLCKIQSMQIILKKFLKKS